MEQKERIASADPSATAQPERELLSSWKEIAAYVGKGVRTVQRWEREAHLPICRPIGDRGRILAFKSDLNQWMESGKNHGSEAEPKAEERIAELTAELAEARAEIERLKAALAETRGLPRVMSSNVTMINCRERAELSESGT